MYKVTANVQFPDNYQSVIKVWGRGVQAGSNRGLAEARIFTQNTFIWTDAIVMLNYTGVSSYSTTSCNVESYFYNGVSFYSGSMEWIPFDPLTKTISYDYSVLGILASTDVDEEVKCVDDFIINSIYPNPIRTSKASSVHLEMTSIMSSNNVVASIKDCLGRVVASRECDVVAGKTRIIDLDVSSAASGIYFVTVMNGRKIITVPLQVIR